MAKDLLSKKFIQIDICEPVSKLIGKFKKSNQTTAVVFDKKKYLGIISHNFLLTSRINPSVIKLSNLIKKRSKSKVNLFSPKLSLDTNLKKIAKLMFSADVHMLPVIEKNSLLGVVKLVDVLKNINKEYKAIPIKTLYSKTPVTVQIDTPIGLIIKIFNRYKFHRVPVTDKNGEFFGMLTISDLLKNYYIWAQNTLRVPNEAQHQGFKRSGYDLGEKISQVNVPIRTMISYAPLYSVKPSVSVNQAVNVMIKADISSVVIVDKKKVVGILTARDVLKDYAKT